VKPSSSPSEGDWWQVFVAAVPCFNQQASLVVGETIKKSVSNKKQFSLGNVRIAEAAA
jgi:hypothetical protein